MCPTLGNPTNGVVDLSGTSVGDTATYTCDNGYELVGTPVLNCQNDGTWDNSPPLCQSVGGKIENLNSMITCHTFFIVVVSFAPTTYTVTEGENEFAELELFKNGNPSIVTVVRVTTRSGTATGIATCPIKENLGKGFLSVAGVDYISIARTVTFETGVDRITIRVPIRDDTEIEKDETFTAVLTRFHQNTVIQSDTAIVTITDFDSKNIESKLPHPDSF